MNDQAFDAGHLTKTEAMLSAHQAAHWSRRTLLKAAGASGMAWLTHVAEALAVQQEKDTHSQPAKSVILLWLAGGPSQLETFDPHPNRRIAAGTRAIPTSIRGVQLAEGLEQTAERVDHLLLLRSVVSREGDHERGLYNVKTGYRPDPSLVHPSIGAVVCHQLPVGTTQIPRHISILPDQAPGRGGYLGDKFDAFQLGDPQGPLPDMKPVVGQGRFSRRLTDLEFLNQRFSRRTSAGTPPNAPLHAGSEAIAQSLDRNDRQHQLTDQALKMMSSEQLRAFDLRGVPRAELLAFGDTAFGRGCLVAGRLIQEGARCVEVTLSGWDSHVANHELHTQLKRTLDPAFASLIQYLSDRSLLDQTIVVCGGEFGRTPAMNPAGGRDHWPYGFSMVLAGGGIPGGRVIGETDPDGQRLNDNQGIPIADIHASILHRLGIQHDLELETPVGRPLKLSEGKVVF
jgi:uncharacterized protein (DUF1501 family)